MKKIIVLVILTLFLTACSNSNDDVKESEMKKGTFYTLQEAYDNDFLTYEDLRNISHFHNDSSMPIIYPDELDTTIEQTIKETRLLELKSYYPEATIEDVFILNYYGQYNDSYVLTIEDNFTVHGMSLWSETIGGITFFYSGSRTLIWRNN